MARAMLAVSLVAAALPAGCDHLPGRRAAAEPVAVPDVTSAYPTGAMAILRHAGLRPRIAAVPGLAGVDECTWLGVGSVSPPAGTRVDAGAAIGARRSWRPRHSPAAAGPSSEGWAEPASLEPPAADGARVG
jgi:hypothetical protein